MYRPYYHYDANRGWDETSPGWYEAVIDSYPSGIAEGEYYLSILDWIEENIQGAIKHSRWTRHSDGHFRFKFRYERDYIWFRLRWG